MNSLIIVAIISASSSIIGASIILFLSKWYEKKTLWKKQKLKHYKKLLISLSNLVLSSQDKMKANQEFSQNCNTVCLIASNDVITILMEIIDLIELPIELKRSDNNKEKILIRNLMVAIRKDIGLTKKDDISSFNFRLINLTPTENAT